MAMPARRVYDMIDLLFISRQAMLAFHMHITHSAGGFFLLLLALFLHGHISIQMLIFAAHLRHGQPKQDDYGTQFDISISRTGV